MTPNQTEVDIPPVKPHKWEKRGVQPAVAPSIQSPLLALNKLASKIREETDPVAKKRLEAQYSAESKALDALTSDPTSVQLKTALTEIVDVFSVIVDPPEHLTAELNMPESMDREQWREVHGTIIRAKHAAASWLSKSRRFASERWGIAFVEQTEIQMELSLGIKARDKPRPAALPNEWLLFTAMERFAHKWDKVDVAAWDADLRGRALESLAPVIAVIERLRA